MTKRVTAHVTFGVDTPRDELSQWQKDATAYTVALRFEGREIITPYYTGVAITEEPTAADVLGSLMMDADATQYPDYEEWADAYGWDPDSRSGEKTYEACRQNGRNVERLLGDSYMRFALTTSDEWKTNEAGDVFVPEATR